MTSAARARARAHGSHEGRPRTRRARVRGRSGARLRRSAALIAIGLALAPLITVLAPAVPAEAHAVVVSTMPANGEQTDARPDAVRVVFDEPVTFPATAAGPGDAATVIDAEGEPIDAGAPVLDEARTTLTIPLPADLPKGTYIASWRVVSADTHPVGGSIEFGYGVPVSVLAGIDVQAAPEPSAALTLAVGVVKGLLYLGLVLALGLLPAALVLGVGVGAAVAPGVGPGVGPALVPGADGRERALVRRTSLVGVAIAIGASLAQVVVQFLWVVSAGAGTELSSAWPAFGAFAASSYGTAVAIRVGALAAIALLLRGRPDAGSFGPTRLWALLALAIVVPATVAQNGHGGAGSGWLFASTVLHAAGAIAWLGGLALLGWLLLRRRLSAERLNRMPVWSLYAGIAVAALAASGLVQAVVGVAYPEALISTGYGLILIVKLLLVTVAIALGVLGYTWTRRQLRAAVAGTEEGRPAPGQTAALRSRVRVEAALGAVIVLLSGVLSSITPAADDYAPIASATTDIGPYAVTVEIAPVRLGPQSLRVTVLPPEENSAQPQELEVSLRQVDGAVQGLEVDFPYRIPGALHPGEATPTTFVSSAVNVPATGSWVASIAIVVDALDQYAGSITYTVR